MAARNISFGVFSADIFAERLSGLPQLRFCRRLPAASQVRAVCILTERFHANKTLTVRRANGSVLALSLNLIS